MTAAADALAEATARMAQRVRRPGLDQRLDQGLMLREAADVDAAALTALIGAAYDEFACGPLDPDGFDADLSRPATHAARRGRHWWVVTTAATEQSTALVGSPTLVASVRHSPLDDRGVVELQRLYLAPTVRGIGLAQALVEGVADEARRLGAHLLEAWSDTRLVRAHARYLAMGFTLASDTRELHDPAGTTELRFDLDLRPAGSPPGSPPGSTPDVSRSSA
jgi:GNAT superfamily N-acetyltransferase